MLGCCVATEGIIPGVRPPVVTAMPLANQASFTEVFLSSDTRPPIPLV